MGIEEWLRDIYLRANLLTRSNRFYDIDCQRKFIESIDPPKTNIERTYAQYISQKYLAIKGTYFFYNVGSAIAIIMYKHRKQTKPEFVSNCDAVFLDDGIGTSIIPQSLYQEYPNIVSIDAVSSGYIDDDLLCKLKAIEEKYPKEKYLYLKCLVRASTYNKIICQYSPRAIITYSEDSFCSSFLTEYCNSKGVKHINIMHGEKEFLIVDSFFSFDKLYVWEQHYLNLFKELHADVRDVQVEKPPLLLIDIDRSKLVKNMVTVYLQEEDKSSLQKWLEIIKRLRNRYIVEVRPHPRMVRKDLLKDIASEVVFQDPNKVRIEDSLAMTEYVIGRDSTVLYQAYLLGKTVIIDNVTDKDKYNILQRGNYIMLEKEHVLLSEFLT